jgi:hypothetical protein
MPTRVVSEEVVNAETVVNSTFQVLRSITLRVTYEHRTKVSWWARWFKKEKPVVSRYKEDYEYFYYGMRWYTTNGQALSLDEDMRINAMFDAYEVRQQMRMHR